MDENHSTPHGTDVFNAHWNCLCDKCRPRRQAIKNLVDSFSQIPLRWIEQLSDGTIALPMWGTLFCPNEPCDVRNIEKLLEPIEIGNEEDEAFAASGWQEVRGTGIYAIEFDDEFLLGIDGAGYDFYSAHWSRLYDALGYSWHEQV
jgi:hypothetical protein